MDKYKATMILRSKLIQGLMDWAYNIDQMGVSDEERQILTEAAEKIVNRREK
jgi:hypothetical protein